MKTITERKTESELKNRPEPLSLKGRLPINFAMRRTNRQLRTQRLLALLRDKAPRFFEIAEVVGKWVWIQFNDRQPCEVTRVLAELGFHWNYTRQAWQHPCGTIRYDRATYDPRRRYGSYFAADVKPV